jgi:hypothetical protein
MKHDPVHPLARGSVPVVGRGGLEVMKSVGTLVTVEVGDD